jgi:PAS domain S-box-containing protein
VRPRQIAPVVLVLALTTAGFFGARLLGERDARREAEQRAEVAAAQIRGRVEQGASLADALQRFMVADAGRGVTSEEFASNAARWLSPAGFPAAAWVERVPAPGRATYERRTGHPIVTRDRRRRIVPVGARSAYLPATLVSGIPPTAVPGIDLGGESGMAAALTRASARNDAVATPLTRLRDGTEGLFVVRLAPRLTEGNFEPGFAAVFVSDAWLRAAATDVPALRLTVGGASTAGREMAGGGRNTFSEAGQRFEVLVPEASVRGAEAILPWIILAAGLVLAALAGALGINAARRAQTQEELDRIFTLSPDLITVADFDGHFRRVNPAADEVLGYTEDELLARPYLDFVHPEDRERTAAEAAAIGHGKTTLSFVNRFVHKDGSHRVLEWTATPAVDDRVMYGVARDVTERRRAEAEAARLADEQAALRRVATLVAQAVPSSDLFRAVAREVGTLLGADFSGMIRYEDDATVAPVATWAAVGDHPPVPDRFRTEAGDPTTMIGETGAPARVQDWTTVPGPIAAFLREELGVTSSVGCPILVEGRLWGALAVHSKQRAPLPAHTESRLAQFTDLVGTAIANAEARTEVERLAEEQAALRRVATLVAEGAPPSAVLDAVTAEMEALLDADQVALNRFEPGDEILVLAHRGLDVARTPVGSRVSVEGESATALVRRTGRPARMESYKGAQGRLADIARATGLRSSVSAPITVEGKLWGLITASWKREESPPHDTEERMVKFAGLLGTAIANTEARAEIERLAQEQAALRRVATLVAQGAPATVVFDAVASEMERLLGADGVTLSRYEPAEEVTVVAHRGANAARVPPGTRVRHSGENVTSIVRRTKRPARLEHYEGTQGPIAELVRDLGVRASVGAPIIVDGQLWGCTIANWQGEQSPPADTEERMTKFAALLDTAIANADSRDQLAASRARLVTAGDEARRRVVRDLHDGAQQRLVHTIVSLKLAQRALLEGDGKAESVVGEALGHAQQANAELRELAHGIHPSVLTRGGLRAGIDAVVARLDLPVEVDLPSERFAEEIEASAYFIVAEALTNVVKHAHADRAEVRAFVEDGMLHLEVRDDGMGGADPGGHGLVGLKDRATALGGRLTVESPAGDGTVVVATLRLADG